MPLFGGKGSKVRNNCPFGAAILESAMKPMNSRIVAHPHPLAGVIARHVSGSTGRQLNENGPSGQATIIHIG